MYSPPPARVWAAAGWSGLVQRRGLDAEAPAAAVARRLFALAARLEVLQIGLRCHVPKGSLPRRVLELSGFEQLAPLDDRPGD